MATQVLSGSRAGLGSVVVTEVKDGLTYMIGRVGAEYTGAPTQPMLLTGIPSSEALGTISFYAIAYMQPTGIASEEALGTTKVVPILRPPGIPSAEMVGSPTLVAIARHGGMFFHGFP